MPEPAETTKEKVVESASTGGGNFGSFTSGVVGAGGAGYLVPDLQVFLFEPIRWIVPYSDVWVETAAKLGAYLIMGLVGWIAGGGAGILLAGASGPAASVAGGLGGMLAAIPRLIGSMTGITVVRKKSNPEAPE